MQSVPITTNVVISSPVHGEVYSIQHYVTGRWISLGTPVSSNNKTDRHYITGILYFFYFHIVMHIYLFNIVLYIIVNRLHSLGCLTPLSGIFQLYRDGKFILVEETGEKLPIYWQ